MPPKGWASLSIRRELREKLEELARGLGFESLNDVIAYLIKRHMEYTDMLVRFEKAFTDISVKLDKLHTNISVRSDVINKTPNPSATAAARPSSNSTKARVFCRPRAEIRNVKGYVEKIKGLRDWWEEGDKVCFEVEEG